MLRHFSLSYLSRLLNIVAAVTALAIFSATEAQAHHISGSYYWYGQAPNRASAQTLVPNSGVSGNDDLIAGSYYSASMQHKVGYMIYLPPDYKPNGAPYPVIYVLHGIHGNELSYFSGSDGYTTSSSLYTERNLISMVANAHRSTNPRDTIIVFVNGGRASFYIDYDGVKDVNGQDHHSRTIAPRYPNGTGDPFPNGWPNGNYDFRILSATTIVRELIPHIDATYNTIESRSGRAIEGFSMGGGGAWRLALQYPNLFCSSVAYAPAGLNQILSQFNPMYAGPLQAKDAASSIAKNNIANIRSYNLKLRTVTGSSDNNAWYNDAVAVRDVLVANGLPATNIDIASRPQGVGHSYKALNRTAGASSFNFHWNCFTSTSVSSVSTPTQNPSQLWLPLIDAP